MKAPNSIFVAIWAFWWLGIIIYAYGLATEAVWATPIGAFTWLLTFGWFEAIALVIGKSENSLSGVSGWLIWLPSKGQDPAWLWLADVIALPIAVLITYTFVRLAGGFVGWTMGLGWAALLLFILHRHLRYMAGLR